MTPKDWNEMKKLLADVAKGNDVREVLEKVDSICETTGRYYYDLECANVIHSYTKSCNVSYSDGDDAYYVKLCDFIAQKDGVVTFVISLTGKNTKSHRGGLDIIENAKDLVSVAEGTKLTSGSTGIYVGGEDSIGLSTASSTLKATVTAEVKAGNYYSARWSQGQYSTAGTTTITGFSLEVYAIEK